MKNTIKIIQLRIIRKYDIVCIEIVKEVKFMSIKVKPIQPTPTLSGKDAQNIIEQVRVVPSQASFERNQRMLALRKKAVH